MQLIHEDLTYRIIGCLFELHNEIGGGHKEKIYQKGLGSVLGLRGISYKEQVMVDLVLYDQPIGKYFLDFLVSDQVIIEIKSRSHFTMSDFRQATAYLQALNLQLAILVAFTPTGVRYRRIVNLPTHIDL